MPKSPDLLASAETPSVAQSETVQRIGELSVIGLADSLFEMYTLEELEHRRDMLNGFAGGCPGVKKLNLIPAVYLALQWKLIEEQRGYAAH